MTWVIGANMPGHCVMLSDICITIDNVETRDLIQKTFPVGNYIACGFSGSVELGFYLLEDLKSCLSTPGRRTAFNPETVSKEWSPRAKLMYGKKIDKKPYLKHNGVDLLLCGISPNEDIGAPIFPKCYTTILKSPNFNPQIYTGIGEIKSIGSGSGIDVYKRELKLFYKQFMKNFLIEHSFPGGVFNAMITRILEKYPRKGISKHVHIVIIKRRSITVGNNNHTIYKNNEVIEIKMPKVAKSFSEMKKILNERNKSAENLRC